MEDSGDYQQGFEDCLKLLEEKAKTRAERDMERSGQRYNRAGMRFMDVLEAYLSPDQFEGFLRGNVLKYLVRYDYKGSAKDLEKADDYLGLLREHVGKTTGGMFDD